MDGINSMTGNPPQLAEFAALAEAYDAILYVDDGHGVGVVSERGRAETSPYGLRGNGVVRHLGQSYDHLVLTGGFSKAYSSLLAFIACPTPVKRLLKVTAPPYLYSGPSPVASLASTLLGLQVNASRGDELRAMLYGKTRRVLDHLEKLGAFTLNRSGFPIVEVPLADAEDLDRVGGAAVRAGDLRHPGLLSRRPQARGRVPAPADRGQHRRPGRRPAGRAGRAGRPRTPTATVALTPSPHDAPSGRRWQAYTCCAESHDEGPAGPTQGSSSVGSDELQASVLVKVGSRAPSCGQ
jgi:hypothetical protein